MPVYVDPLMDFGWIRRGIPTRNCHLFTDSIELGELHALAAQIGMPRHAFQPHLKAPHYDLDPPMRERALVAGAIAVDRRNAVRLWQGRMARIAKAGK